MASRPTSTLVRRFRVWLLVALIPLAGSPRVASAWRDNGHIAVAKVADHFLNAVARQKIAALLGGSRSIHDRSVCVFADVYKKTAGGEHTKTWHYVNVPQPDKTYDPARDCPHGACVVAQIVEQKKILADLSRPAAERALALKFVVHLVGDIHQPLHCTERFGDRGGNLVPVRFLTSIGTSNLHEAWDDLIVGDLLQELDPVEFADRVAAKLDPARKKAWELVTDPVAWVMEGHALAASVVYDGIARQGGAPATLDRAYVNRAGAAVQAQILAAGVRLAHLLDDILGR